MGGEREKKKKKKKKMEPGMDNEPDLSQNICSETQFKGQVQDLG